MLIALFLIAIFMIIFIIFITFPFPFSLFFFYIFLRGHSYPSLNIWQDNIHEQVQQLNCPGQLSQLTKNNTDTEYSASNHLPENDHN